MRLLCDENLFGAQALLSELGHCTFMPGRAIDNAAVAAADALLLRSQTRVDGALLGACRPRFVGTATAGTEHVDRALLAKLGVPFAHAPASNAAPVADWVMAVVAAAMLDGLVARRGARCAIIGCGAVGGRVADRLAAFGFEVLCHDPPAQARGVRLPGRSVTLSEALMAEVITLHVPRVDEGPWPTRDLLDAERIAGLAPGTLVLNAARGGVVDDAALERRMHRRGDLHVALDVYAHEPAPSSGLLEVCRVATPHIAGHSVDGKARGTVMIRDALARSVGQATTTTIDAVLPLAPVPAVVAPTEEAALRFIADARSIAEDTVAFRSATGPRAEAFAAQRRDYAAHRDFSARKVVAQGEAAVLLAAAGFDVLRDAS